MKQFGAVSVFAVMFLACAGNSGNVQPDSVQEYDPELYEVCLTEDPPAERACIKQTDSLGRVTWGFPLGKSEEYTQSHQLISAGHYDAAVHVLSAMIRKPDHFKCGGRACDRIRLNVECESQMARVYRLQIYIKTERYREAFLDLAQIIRIGPEHYQYEQVPELFKALEGYLPSGVLAVCRTAYVYPEETLRIKGRDRHWKPYTKEDPAPEW